jgi:hypothetical protein
MKLKSLKELNVLLNNSDTYKGKMKDYQTNHSSHDNINYYSIKLNDYQNFLYKRALFGIKIYDKEFINTMHYSKIKRIKKVNRRTQMLINKLKQKKSNQKCLILLKIFHNSKLAKDLFSTKKVEYDDNFINTLPLKSLNITKFDIIKMLIDEKVLPSNFYTLKNDKEKLKGVC